jgi:hypothetical protein
MPTPPPPQGFFGLPDLGNLVGDLSKILPPQVAGALKDTISGIIGDGPINIGDPQPPGERPIPVEPGTGPFKAVIGVLDTALRALDFLKNLNLIIPDEYEDLFSKLAGALRTVRSWLD